MKDLIEKIRSEAISHFEGTGPSHGWDHTERVLRLAHHIRETEGGDPVVIELAVLLHDIGRRLEDESLGEICHAEEGAKLARVILDRHGVDEDVVRRVIHCVEHHRFRGKDRPDTLEAKIVFDADKLDSIGAVGIGRAFLFAGENRARLHNDPDTDPMKAEAYSEEDTAYREFLHKLRHVHERMLTDEGKRLARERHDFMLIFFQRLNDEFAGRI